MAYCSLLFVQCIWWFAFQHIYSTWIKDPIEISNKIVFLNLFSNILKVLSCSMRNHTRKFLCIFLNSKIWMGKKCSHVVTRSIILRKMQENYSNPPPAGLNIPNSKKLGHFFSIPTLRMINGFYSWSLLSCISKSALSC